MRGSVRNWALAAVALALMSPDLVAPGVTARAVASAGGISSARGAAASRAESTGKPVPVASMTTATTMTTADPGGGFTVTENAVPVRVRHGSGWIPVSTALARGTGGRLVPRAVPGDAVSFSAGGTGPMATITAAGTSLSLMWPDGPLPAPEVSGSSATYRNVLPGVDLVLSATSDQSGGFSEVLVVHSAAAARDPALARLRLGAATGGVRLTGDGHGGLVAYRPGAPGYYQAAPTQMWDSSAFPPSRALPAASVISALARSARAAGATLAPPGSGPASSSAAGPASGARVAAVAASVSGDGTALTLTPDAALLASAATRFPVYIDPSFEWHAEDGLEQHRDEVQSACPTASHYDAADGANDTYWSLGVGYDGFGDCNGINGTAYAYYQLRVPPEIWGGSVFTATVNAQEAYSADCSTSASVTLSQTSGIGAATDWNNKPGPVSGSSANNVTVSAPPNPQSCNMTYDTSPSAWIAVPGFNVLSEMKAAAYGKWKSFTFRLWQQGSPSDVAWRRFGPAPYLQIQYNQTPDTPTSLHISSGTTTDAECATSSYPWVGKLATSGPGTTMSALVHDKDGDQLAGHFTYWVDGSSTKTSTDSPAVASGGTARAVIPPSWTNALTDGTEVDWTVYAYDGAPAGYGPDSGTSATCHFYVYPSAPAAPTLSGGPGTTEPPPGTQETYTVTAASLSGATLKAIVWGLDKAPPVTSPPSQNVVTVSSGMTATVTFYVPSGGPHAFYAYAEYSTGPASQLQTDTWLASNDPNVSCPSFADALAGTGCVNETTGAATTATAANTMISNGSGNTIGTANGDGTKAGFPATDLEAAGWTPGGKVTVDGATFTLPNFGSSGSGPDNLLAANQTIGMPADSQGTSLVFLVTGTYGDAAAPDPSDVAQPVSPAVPQGSVEVGQDCDAYQSGQQDSSGNDLCTPAPPGTITYAAGYGAPDQAYSLTSPTWFDALGKLMDVITTPEVVSVNGLGKGGHPAGIWAFSVPINPNAPVVSVTLPDIGAMVDPVIGTGWPALHVFGIAVANTTTATPGSSAANAAGPWTGSWASPPEGSFAPLPGTSYSNQTIRIATQASVGGTGLRLRLSDSLAASGTAPLSIGAVTVAQQGSGAAATGPPTAVAFGGKDSVTIPEGGDVYSDPVPLAVTAGEQLDVSIDLVGSYPSLPKDTWCSACTEWITAANAGDKTANTDGSPFSGAGTQHGDFTTILTGLDVLSASGLPTVAVLGDGVVDGAGSGTPVHGALRVSDDLASALALQPGGPTFGVVNAGIEANQVLTDTDTATGAAGGPSALSRLARDVLAEPNVGTVIIDEGTEDLLAGTTEQALLGSGLGELSSELQAWGITVIYATVPACYGYNPSADPCTTAVDSTRTTFNTDLLGQGANAAAGCSLSSIPPAIPPCVFTVDFAGAVGNTASPQQLIANADAGDHVNLTAAGYLAEAGTIPVIAGQNTPLTAVAPPGY